MSASGAAVDDDDNGQARRRRRADLVNPQPESNAIVVELQEAAKGPVRRAKATNTTPHRQGTRGSRMIDVPAKHGLSQQKLL